MCIMIVYPLFIEDYMNFMLNILHNKQMPSFLRGTSHDLLRLVVAHEMSQHIRYITC